MIQDILVFEFFKMFLFTFMYCVKNYDTPYKPVMLFCYVVNCHFTILVNKHMYFIPICKTAFCYIKRFLHLVFWTNLFSYNVLELVLVIHMLIKAAYMYDCYDKKKCIYCLVNGRI